VKKIIFALISAAAMASIPLNVNAANACEINIASGEEMTINYDLNAAYNTNNCHVVNNGTLYIKSGANIEAYDGYAVRNYGNTIMTGGNVKSDIHQAIWVTSGSLTVSGGTLSSAGGYEENIYSTANGKIDVCGNYSYVGQGTVLKCGIAPAPTQPQTPATPAPASEIITITITSSEKKTENTSTTSAPVVKTPAPSPRTIASAPVATAQTTTPATPVVEGPKKEAPVVKKKTEKKAPAIKEEAESLPTAGVTLTNDENSVFIIALTASLILLGTASVAIATSRIRA